MVLSKLNWKVRRSTYLVSEEATADVDLFTSNHIDFLARKDLLRYDGGQTSKEMSLAIDDDGCRGESGHCRGLPADQSAVIKIPQ